MQTVLNFARTKLKSKIDVLRKNPDPFPGIYPTRWALGLRDPKGKLVFRYVGKPNLFRALEFLRLTHKTLGSARLIEFDLGGPIRMASSKTPADCFTCLEPRSYLAYYYYPFSHAMPNSFFHAWLQKTSHVQLKIGHRTWFVYKHQDADPELLREYRAFLRKYNMGFCARTVNTVPRKCAHRLVEFIELDKLPRKLTWQFRCEACGRGYPAAAGGMMVCLCGTLVIAKQV